MKTKKCPYCGNVKLKTEFHKNRSKSGGLSCGCKSCMNYRKRGLKPRYNKYLNNARYKNRTFDLDIEEFDLLTKQPCFFCGGYSSEFNGEFYTGLDRIDDRGGYSIKNCRPCCDVCNFMKRKMTAQSFLAHINKIYAHSNSEQDSG